MKLWVLNSRRMIFLAFVILCLFGLNIFQLFEINRLERESLAAKALLGVAIDKIIECEYGLPMTPPVKPQRGVNKGIEL